MSQFACPRCRTALGAGPSTNGVVTCPACGVRVQLPPANPGHAAPAPPPLAVPVAAAPTSAGPPQAIPVATPAAGTVPQAIPVAAAPRKPVPADEPSDEIPDEDEATLRAGLPPGFPVVALGRLRFRTEQGRYERRMGGPVIGFGAILLLGLLFLYFGLRRALGPSEWFGPDTMSRASAWLCVLFVALPLTAVPAWLCVHIIRGLIRQLRTYAVVAEGGFVLCDGSRFTVWRWEDIAAVSPQRMELRTYNVVVVIMTVDRMVTTLYRLRHRDGTEYEFWSTRGPRTAQLGALVEQQTYRLLYPAARAEMQAGRPVEFKPFRMEPDGLAFRGGLTPWREIRRVYVRNGNLWIDGAGSGGGTARSRLGRIDNWHVFLPLLEEKLGLRIRADC